MYVTLEHLRLTTCGSGGCTMKRSVFGGSGLRGSAHASASSSLAALRLRRISSYRRRLLIRLALSAVLLCAVIWFEFFSSHAHHRANNAGPMLLNVGDCFQRPTGTSLTSVSPVPCSAAHTAQLYKLYAPGSFDCLGGALETGSLPPGAGRALYTFTKQDGSLISACVIVTPPTTGSAM